MRGGGSIDDEGPLAALRAFGATPEQIEQARKAIQERGDDLCRIFPCNWPALMVFLTLDTQWRFSSLGRRIGIDYTAVEPVMRLLGVQRNKWGDTFARLRTIEAAAIEELTRS